MLSLNIAMPLLFGVVQRAMDADEWATEIFKDSELGGCYDSKRMGIFEWNTLWKGWFRLMNKVETYIDTKNYSDLIKKDQIKRQRYRGRSECLLLVAGYIDCLAEIVSLAVDHLPH